MLAFSTPARVFCVTVAVLFGADSLASPPTTNDAHQTIGAGGHRIAGIVVSKADGHPLARARISLKDAKDPQKFQSLITAEGGKFEFSGLSAGRYVLEGAKRGFVSSSYDQHDQFSTAIVAGPGLDTGNLVLRLTPDAVITGKVLDEVGEPIEGATVTLYYDDHGAGIGEIHEFRSAQTDGRGAYEITPVMPGTYFLSASATPWYAVHPSSQAERRAGATGAFDRSLDVAYPVTYYADVLESDGATPIPVRGGERLEVDVHLVPVPAIRIFLHVPDGGPHAATLPQLEQSAFDGSTTPRPSASNVVSPGIVELTGIPAGHYNVLLQDPGRGLRMNGVDLTKDGTEIDTSSAETLSNVKVLARALGETAVPSGLSIGLRSRRTRSDIWQSIDLKGEAEFQQIAAGRYEVVVRGAGNSYSIGHIAAEGAEVSGRTLSVVADSSPSILLTLVVGDVEIQGTVQRTGKPFAGAMVVLVPKNAEANLDLFRRAQSGSDGTFSVQGVVPGSYTVLAFENWDLDWSQPKAIAAYLKHGQAIEVNQNTRPINLAEAIEVQSK